MSDDIKLPALPRQAINWTEDGRETLRDYARAAVLADREARGEPYAWVSRTGHGDFIRFSITPELAALRWGDKPVWTPVYARPQPEARGEPVAEVAWKADIPGTMLEVRGRDLWKLPVGTKLYAAPQPEARGEPAAWMHAKYDHCVSVDPTAYANARPLYTAPQPKAQTKPRPRRDGTYKVLYKCKDCGHEQAISEAVVNGSTYIGGSANWCSKCPSGLPVRVGDNTAPQPEEKP